MAYKNARLVVAGISGDIYLTRVLKDRTMSLERKEVTMDVLRASTEWFMHNDKKMIQFSAKSEEVAPTLFFTADPAKAEQILAILEGKTDGTVDAD